MSTADARIADRIVIRQESPDQPAVRALLQQLDDYLGSLYEPEANHLLTVEELLAPDVAFFVVRDGDRAVGTGAFRRKPGEGSTDGLAYGEIKRMYLSPALRGRRLASRLLGHLEDCLRAEGFPLALLETGEEQHEAVRLYERSGYARRAAFAGYPDNGLSVFYGKRL